MTTARRSEVAIPAEERRSVGLQLHDLTCRYGDLVAVRQVNLDVASGELISVLGPSGCGKSTMLRAIAGLQPVGDGEIAIAGRPVQDIKPRDRGVAFVFQSYALYPHMTARQNIAAPLVMTELSALGRIPLIHRLLPKAVATRQSIAARVAEVAELLRMTELLDRRPAALSGGQQQRVALGRALIRAPDLFLLDEPLANLDAALRNATRTELRALQQRLGTTTLFVTHDQAEAMAISDRVAIMFDGELRQIGTPDALYRQPVDLDVARFLSQPHLNVLSADLVATLGQVRGGDRDLGTWGYDHVIAFRPEHARLLPADDTADASTGDASRPMIDVPVTLTSTEHGGVEAYVFAETGGGGTDEATQIVARIASRDLHRWQPGASARVRVTLDDAYVFPTGRPRARVRRTMIGDAEQDGGAADAGRAR
ncbi:MAG: ABC transporter ATP-binding protein [Pseudomonadota bacterium]